MAFEKYHNGLLLLFCSEIFTGSDAVLPQGKYYFGSGLGTTASFSVSAGTGRSSFTACPQDHAAGGYPLYTTTTHTSSKKSKIHRYW